MKCVLDRIVSVIWFDSRWLIAGGGQDILTWMVIKTKIILDFPCTADGSVMFVRGETRFMHLGLGFHSWSKKYWLGIYGTWWVTSQCFSDIIMCQDGFEITTEPYAGGPSDCAYTQSWRHEWHVGYYMYVGLCHRCRRITYTESGNSGCWECSVQEALHRIVDYGVLL